MRKGHEYDWHNSGSSESRDFICGHCGAAVSSKEHFNGWLKIGGGQPGWEIYICHSCGKPNFFDVDGSQSPILYNQEEDFPDHIHVLSEEFVTTYNQALSAEKLGFDRIAGPGYRRALEFLIKDFLIYQVPTEDVAASEEAIAAIKAKQLGPCIDDLSNERIKTTTRGATYIGNDETHYERRWPDKDIQDLKRFISLTVHWIEAELATIEMQKDMGL